MNKEQIVFSPLVGAKGRLILIFLILLPVMAWAQGPNNSGTYYRSADGKKGAALKTALYSIISDHTNIGYDGLWEAYKKTDLRPDGKIWDMYSNKTNFDPDRDRAGNYKKEGDVFNREHSMPQSWFNEAAPMKSDIVHVVPTDGYVNNRRSNMPFGENRGEKYSSNGGFSKVGACTVSGYSGTVFEPADEYKGDFARIYFYMATCYENRIASWGGDVITGNSYKPYATWYMDMLMRWAKNDPVSQKEIDRNNAVYSVQKNRNPFVDYPGLEVYVWGDSVNVAFDYDNYCYNGLGNGGGETGGGETGGGNGGDEPGGNGGETGGEGGDEPVVPDVSGAAEPGSTQTYRLATSDSHLLAGAAYLIVCPEKHKALAAPISSGKAYDYADVNIYGDVITTTVNLAAGVREVILSGSPDRYMLTDAVSGNVIGLTSSENALRSTEYTDELGDSWMWSISLGTEAVITNKAYNNRTIRYNSGSPRFACYTSGQTAVSMFVRQSDLDGISEVESDTNAPLVIYTLDGRRAAGVLCPGIYIVDGKKVVIK